MPKRETSFAEYIRDRLISDGAAYPKQLQEGYNDYCDRKGYPETSYDSARSTVYTLKNLDLIETAYTESVEAGIEPRQYYRLTAGAQDRDWSDPRGQLYERE